MIRIEIFKLWGTIAINKDEAARDIQSVEQQAQKSSNNIGRFFGNIAKSFLGITAAATAVKGVMMALVNSTAQYADEIDKTSMKLGLTTDSLQELRFVADQTGVSQGSLERAIGRLNQRLGAGEDSSGQFQGALERLNITATDTDDAFMQIVSSLSDLQNEQEAAAIAGEIFGTRTARELLPAIRAGGQEIENLRNRAHDLGIVMENDAINANVKFADSMDEVRKTFGSVGRNLTAYFLPTMQRVLDWLLDNLNKIPPTVEFIGDVFGIIFSHIPGLIRPVLDVFDNLFGDAWRWSLDYIGDAWDWIWGTSLEEKLDDVRDWFSKGWDWLLDVSSSVWDWIWGTSLQEKIDDMRGWFSAGWEWIVDLAKDSWEWLDEKAPWLTNIFRTLWGWISRGWNWVVRTPSVFWNWLDEKAPWLTDFFRTLRDLIIGGWEWLVETGGDAWSWFKDTTWEEKWVDIRGWITDFGDWAINTAGSAWDWFLDTRLGQWLDDMRKRIADSDAWKWTVDVAFPAIVDGANVVITAIVEVAGDFYQSIKKGFQTGDWSDFWDVSTDIWQTGVIVWVGLKLASGAAAAIYGAIAGVFAGGAAVAGLPAITAAGAAAGIVGIVSVVLRLMEAKRGGLGYKDFAEHVVLAGLAAVLIGLSPVGPMGGLLAFSVLMNIELGEISENIVQSVVETIRQIQDLTEEEERNLAAFMEWGEYRQEMISRAESNIPEDASWIQRQVASYRIGSNPRDFADALDLHEYQEMVELLRDFEQGFVEVDEELEERFQSIIDGTELMDRAFYDMAQNVVGNSYVPDMVDGIEREFDKLHGIFDSMISKVGLLDDAFYYLYDDVVGNSYVPMMVDGVVEGMDTIDEALDGTQDEIKDTTNAWKSMWLEIDQRYDQLLLDWEEAGRNRQTSRLPQEVPPPGPPPDEEAEKELTLLESAWDSTLASITNKTANWIVDMYREFALGTLTWQDALVGFADIAGTTMRNLFVDISEGFVKSLVDQDSWVRRTLVNVTSVVGGMLAQAYATLLAVFAWMGPLAPVAAGAVIAAGVAGLARLGVHVGGMISDRVSGIPDEDDQEIDDDVSGRRSGGRQISEITGPTRDLLVDLLSPLASLDSLTGIGNRIYDLLEARLPENDGLVAASMGGGDIVFESGAITVQGTADAVDDMYEAIAERFANDRRKWGKLGVRYRQ